MSGPVFQRVALIGLGLIGSSIAHAARAKGVAAEIVGSARSEKTRGRVKELGFLDEVFDTAGEAVKGADLVILCVPVRTSEAIAREIGPHLAPGAIVTDVGSVKGSVVADVEPHIPDNCVFVAGHPISGTENSGPDSGFAELFDGRWCILTPSKKSTPEATEKLSKFWNSLGSNVDTMDPEHMRWIADEVQRGRYLHCPNGSHLALYDDQETYFDGLIQFLQDMDEGNF